MTRWPEMARMAHLLADDQALVGLDPALFAASDELIVTRAPGRLDVMGGIADYSGSLVLELPLREAAICAAGLVHAGRGRAAGEIRIVSPGADSTTRTPFSCEIADLLPGGQPLPYADARAWFRRNPATSWAAYLAGAVLVLAHERGVRFDRGLHMLLLSDVPEGKGVSSSAAIEVAALSAIARLAGLGLTGREIAHLAQRVENEIVGAPCGLMDQMTSACGEQGRLLPMLCQPDQLAPAVNLPADLAVWGIDSGVRHAVSGADYGSVRVGAFMGRTILFEAAGAGAGAWRGHLANVTPEDWQRFAPQVPAWLPGADFIARWRDHGDPVTRIDPARRYAVAAATAHAVFENARVNHFVDLLRGPGPVSDERARQLGALMFASHDSYSSCGLGSAATDALVERVHAHGGPLFGAKITGGGSGGTVAVLGRPEADAAIDALATAHAREHGIVPRVFRGSSPGAAAFGAVTFARR